MPSIDLEKIPSAREGAGRAPGTQGNEPKVHASAHGFLSVPTVGMRLAPELLVLELFREAFFSSTDERRKGKGQELDPDLRDDDNNPVFSDGAQAVIHALRGRRKQQKHLSDQFFYGPAYPAIAGHAWWSSKRERVIRGLLFKGAFAQRLWGRSDQDAASAKLQTETIDRMLAAFTGTLKLKPGGALEREDILAACVRGMEPVAEPDVARVLLATATGASDTVFRTPDGTDELAKRIFDDFAEICRVEARLPRLLWVRLLMTYLRFALPMWLLAQMRITVMVHGWVMRAIDGGECPDDKAILAAIAGRNRSLIRPTLTGTREVLGRITEYMRCRVGLNVVLYSLEQLRPADFSGKVITTTDQGANKLKLSELLILARKAGDDFRSDPAFGGAPGAATFAARVSERYPAWRDPLNAGQGKNIDEFLRVLYRAERGDEAGGHLLVRQGRADSTTFRVFPGHMLLQVIALLANKSKQGGGRLVLKDIEDHFAEYGIDFAMAADARPGVMEGLKSLGLLAGSPDAGSSVAVTCPF